MRVRAIKDLTQLAEPAFFDAVSEGLGLIVKNATRLWDAARTLHDAGQHHGARVLAIIAEEEAAKYMILIDAVRCPREPNDRFARHLGRFNDHLAKGLYARAGWMRPSSLSQLQEYVNLHRDEFYLDGPSGADWIFRNEISQAREGVLYVDYVALGDAHHWSEPTQYEELLTLLPTPAALSTARNLHDVGASAPAALAVVAGFWRANPPVADTHWGDIRKANYRTLTLLDDQGLLREQPQEIYSSFVNDWPFPMYDLDLTQIPVSIAFLQERQRAWNPDW